MEAIRALEMETHQLVGLALAIEVIRQPLVQLRTHVLRCATVDGVVDQSVPEAKLDVTRDP